VKRSINRISLFCIVVVLLKVLQIACKLFKKKKKALIFINASIHAEKVNILLEIIFVMSYVT
jgi:hypothetical protein